MQSSCPYLADTDADLQARQEWNRKDDGILGRRLGKRPKKRNKPYKGAPNTVDPIINDLATDKTDQEISMILNAPVVAIFIPLGDVPASYTTMAQKGFNTYLRHMCGYRQKKEVAVDTKNARGFAITKQITENTDEWGVIPSFDTVDPKDLIVPPRTTDIRRAERVTHVMRLSLREFKDKPKTGGWNRKAVAAVAKKLVHKDSEGTERVATSDHDDENTFTVTKALIGLNTSDVDNDKIVVWEICHYATQWDVEKSNGIVGLGDKCVSTVCPDCPEELLHIVAWREDSTFENLAGAELEAEMRSAQFDSREPDVVREVRGRDKPWPYIQHRYENRSLLWYDSRGIGHTCMDNQIIATAIQNGKLIQLDYASMPVFEGTGTPNEQNVTVKPGTVLPEGLKPVTMKPVTAELAFENDYQRRLASQRTASGAGTYSAEVSSSRKLEKTATEVKSENAKGDTVSSASVDRFNDADRQLFPMLWNELRRMGTELPMIGAGLKFEGMMPADIYKHRFLIVPAASEKTLNPDMQFIKDREIIEMNAEHAEVTGADIGAGLRRVTEKVDTNLAHTLYPDPNSGELPIAPVLMRLQQQVEQLAANVEQNSKRVDQALQLGSEVAGAL